MGEKLDVQGDLLPLVVTHKNATVALTMLHHLLNQRLRFRSKVDELRCRAVAGGANEVKAMELAVGAVAARLSQAPTLGGGEHAESLVSQDEILQTLGLPAARDLLGLFAEGKVASQTNSTEPGDAPNLKVTSNRDWSQANGCYFAVIKHKQTFLVRHYKLSRVAEALEHALVPPHPEVAAAAAERRIRERQNDEDYVAPSPQVCCPLSAAFFLISHLFSLLFSALLCPLFSALFPSLSCPSIGPMTSHSATHACRLWAMACSGGSKMRPFRRPIRASHC